MVPHFVLTPNFVVKEWEPLLIKISQFLRLQPRSESEGGSRDTLKAIFRMGVLRVHWPQKTSQLSQYTLCVQLRPCTSNGTNGQLSQQSHPT